MGYQGSIPGRDRPKSLKQVMTALMQNAQLHVWGSSEMTIIYGCPVSQEMKRNGDVFIRVKNSRVGRTSETHKKKTKMMITCSKQVASGNDKKEGKRMHSNSSPNLNPTHFCYCWKVLEAGIVVHLKNIFKNIFTHHCLVKTNAVHTQI